MAYNDPTTNQGQPHRGPVLAPEVSIEDYTLTLDDSCLGCTLRLVDENDNVVYTTIINGGKIQLHKKQDFNLPEGISLEMDEGSIF